MNKSIYINFQTKDGIQEARITPNQGDFEKWTAKNLRTRGNKLFLILPNKDAKDFFVTSSITDIDAYFHYVFMGDMLFIQEFEYGDYKEVLGYLTDLFEVTEPIDISISNN